MTTQGAAARRFDLPAEIPFPYFADRESPWLLARQMPPAAPLRALKAGPLARFVERPMVRPIVSACGGTLVRADVAAIAAADGGAAAPATAAVEAGLTASFDRTWHDFTLSFAAWGETDWDVYCQTSRRASNLVIQLGFPSDHAALMGRYLCAGARKEFEYDQHPVRQGGRPTLAWARVDLEGTTALVEEVQSDWLRFAAEAVRTAENYWPRSRELKSLRAYDADLRARYEKLWPPAILLATIGVLVDDLGVRDVFMHQPAAGAALKRIGGSKPPFSLYSALPKRFGFAPTDAAPPFLEKPCRRLLRTLRRGDVPIFWHLSL